MLRYLLTSATLLTATFAPAFGADEKAAQAAEVGDTVILKNPSLDYICSNREDASKIYYAGLIALDNEYRMGTSSWTATKAKYEARKQALRTAYSCGVSGSDVRFLIEQKKVIGKKDDVFYVVNYCLKGLNTSEPMKECAWIVVEQDASSPFKTVVKKGT
jgi:hypothetical protein